MTVAAAFAAALAAIATALAAMPTVAARPALRHVATMLWLATLALAMATAPDGGIAAQSLAIAAGLLGAYVRTRGAAAPGKQSADEGRAAPSMLAAWLALPWLLTAALQPTVMPVWTGGAQLLSAIGALAAALVIASTLPLVLSFDWRWRLVVALALAFAPLLGPIELREAWVELPMSDGAHATLRAAGRPEMGQWPAWIGWAWDAPRWLAVGGISAMLAARPRLARLCWGAGGLLALAATIGAATVAESLLESQALTIAGAEGALRVVGDVGVGMGPGMARVGLLLLMLPLLDPRLRRGSVAGSEPEWPRFDAAATLVSALVWLALSLWAPAAIGAMWPLDPASAALAVMALAAIARQGSHRVGLVTVLTLVEFAAALLLIGGGSAWRVASAWMV